MGPSPSEYAGSEYRTSYPAGEIYQPYPLKDGRFRPLAPRQVRDYYPRPLEIAPFEALTGSPS